MYRIEIDGEADYVTTLDELKLYVRGMLIGAGCPADVAEEILREALDDVQLMGYAEMVPEQGPVFMIDETEE